MSKSQSTAIAKMVAIEGWTLDVTEDEPRVLDEELGRRLGFSRPREIRKLIERMAKTGKLLGVLQRATATRYESKPGIWQERVVDQYWLTEAQALKVVAKSETAIADAILDEVIRVFIAYRIGHLPTPTPEQVPVLSASPLVGDSRVHRSEIAAWCRLAARNSNVSVHRVHGEVRRQFRAPGIYQIPLVLYPQARELIESLALGRLLLAGKPVERRLALVQDEPQHVLPFPAKPGA